MEYKRQCSNWLLAFRDWSLPRSEAPESFHLWAGLFTLASVIKRKVKIPKKILGGWEVSPTLYVIFVAPAGRARKSTTGGYAEELLREIPIVARAATAMTKEVLLKKLSEVRDSSLSVFSSEFAMFIQKSGTDMYDVLTHMFDGNLDVSVETIGRPLDFAEKPCINMLGCTTPDWISSNMPENVIGGGFASRVIFVFEERKRRSKLFYDEAENGELGLDWEAGAKQKEALVADLSHIATMLEGEFSFTPEARKLMKDWYEKEGETEADNYRLQGYYERKPAHTLKIAMLLHIAKSDVLEIDIEDMAGALTILEDLEKKLPKTFANIGKNAYTSELTRIVEFIQRRREVTMKEVLVNFYQAADPRKLQELIQGLIAAGIVRKFIDPEDPNDISKIRLRASSVHPLL